MTINSSPLTRTSNNTFFSSQNLMLELEIHLWLDSIATLERNAGAMHCFALLYYSSFSNHVIKQIFVTSLPRWKLQTNNSIWFNLIYLVLINKKGILIALFQIRNFFGWLWCSVIQCKSSIFFKLLYIAFYLLIWHN